MRCILRKKDGYTTHKVSHAPRQIRAADQKRRLADPIVLFISVSVEDKQNRCLELRKIEVQIIVLVNRRVNIAVSLTTAPLPPRASPLLPSQHPFTLLSSESRNFTQELGSKQEQSLNLKKENHLQSNNTKRTMLCFRQPKTKDDGVEGIRISRLPSQRFVRKSCLKQSYVFVASKWIEY